MLEFIMWNTRTHTHTHTITSLTSSPGATDAFFLKKEKPKIIIVITSAIGQWMRSEACLMMQIIMNEFLPWLS